MVPKAFTRMNIADMQLHQRHSRSLDGIENSHTGMGVSGGIDDDSVLGLEGPLDFINNLPLVIGLKNRQLNSLG